MIPATKSKGDFEPMAEGAYPARIYQVIQLGTIAGWQGKLQSKVRISFEFPTELTTFSEEKGEQPYSLSQDYTTSIHEKSQLRKVIDACDPKALKTVGEDGMVDNYDVEQLLGKTCLVTVVHNPSKTTDAVYANIDGCTVLPKGMTCPPAINENVSLSFDNFDVKVFDALPDFIKKKIQSSIEYQNMVRDPNEPPFLTLEDVE